MKDKIEIKPEYKQLFASNGLNTFDDFLLFKKGEIVDKNKKRRVIKFALRDSQKRENRVFYLKQFHKSSFNENIKKFFDITSPRTEAGTEWNNVKILFNSGFYSIPLAAYGERTVFGLEKSSFFLSEEIPHSFPLEDWLLHYPDQQHRVKIVDELSVLVKKLHNVNISYPDLYIKHIFLDIVALKENYIRFVLLDLHRMRKKRKISLNDCVKDLAALVFSARNILTSQEIDIIIKKYFQHKTDKHKWQLALNKRLAKLSRRRSGSKGVLVREIVDKDRPGHLYINENYVSSFARNGIHSFSDIYDLKTDGHKFTDNPGRTVETFSLDNNRMFIKKHFPANKKISSRDEKNIVNFASLEWENHLICGNLGINVPIPVLWGYALDPARAVMVTLEIPNNESLENILKNNNLPVDFAKRLDFLRQIAKIATSLHRNNYCHKDFYTGHVLVQSEGLTDISDPVFFLIDLQRVVKMKFLKQRWIVKDLAQLNFTSDYECVNLKDKLRFMRFYFGVNKFSKDHKKIMVKIFKKTDRMRRHIPKVLKRKNITSWDEV